MIHYHPETNLELMRMELYDAVHKAEVILTLPTVFYFEGEAESKMYSFVHPNKLAEMVYDNLQSFKQFGWSVAIIFQDGITHVFFGSNNRILEIPEVFNLAVVGSC